MRQSRSAPATSSACERLRPWKAPAFSRSRSPRRWQPAICRSAISTTSSSRRQSSIARTRQVAEELGIPFDVVERVFLAFGLPQPLPNDLAREDDAAILRGLKALLDAIDEADVLGLARLSGDALRGLAEHQLHLFHTRVEDRFRKAGVPEAQVLDVALREVGVRTSPLGELLAAWLYRRHSETFTVEHRVLHGEDDLERAGIHRRAPADPPAIVFLDITGYTRLTEELGDEASAAMPMRLASLVQEAASRYSGRTLKWIGDGVELYFRRPADAVRCSLELRDRIPEADIPGTHVGINAGPVVYENGDFYGRTVNIAARIAAYAEERASHRERGGRLARGR